MLLAERPDLTGEQVKGLISANATRNVIKDSSTGTTIESRVQAQGNGLVDLDDALSGRVALGPVSTSFGTIPSGSRQTRTEQVTVTNLGSSEASLSAAIAEAHGAGASFSVSPATATLAGGASTVLTVTVSVARARRQVPSRVPRPDGRQRC